MWLHKNIASKSDKESSIQIKSLRQLTEEYPSRYQQLITHIIKDYPEFKNDIELLEKIIDLAIKTVENNMDVDLILKSGICELIKANPGLTDINNRAHLEQVGELLMGWAREAVANKSHPGDLFKFAITELVRGNPELAKIENKIHLEDIVGALMILDKKAVKNNSNLTYFYFSGLIQTNPELSKIENKAQLVMLLELGINAAENKLDPKFLLSDVIPGLIKANPELAKIENKETLKRNVDLFLELGIKTSEKNFDVDDLFREGIFNLIETNPELVRIENTMQLITLLELGIKAAENEFDPRCLFQFGLNPLLKANPKLTKIEKQAPLEEFAKLFLELGIKAVGNKAEPFDLFAYGIAELLKANPELSKIKNKKHLEDIGKMLLEFEIKADEYGLNSEDFIEHGISPLLKANPELARVKNKDHLKEFGEMFLGFEKIIFENITIITGTFRRLVHDLIKSNPELAKIENMSHLAVFGKLLLELGTKTAKNKLHAKDFYKELSELIKANPELAKLKNLKVLERYADSILTIFLNTNDYNKERIADLINNNFSKFNLEQTESLLKLLEKVILKHPRLAYPIFEGIFVAIDQGILSKNLTSEDESRILEFIAQTNSFEPVFYKAYEKHGQHFISTLKKSGQNILSDQFTEADLKKLSSYFTGDKNEVTLALIQTKIPLSGASFVSKEEALGLYKGMSATGDLKKHIPLYWQNKEIEKEIEVFEMKVRAGEEVDKEGKVKKVIELLRDKNHPSKDEVLKELTHYLEKGQNDPGSLDQLENKQKFLETFLRYAGQKDLLGEKIDRLANKDYYTLRILEEISKDKDNLPTLLKELLAEIEQTNPQLLKIKNEYQKISNVDHLLKHINKNLPKLPSEDMRIKALSKILMKYDPKEIEKLLIPKVKEKDLAVLIKIVIAQENASLLSQSKMIDKLLADQIASIRHELLKFENISKEEDLKLGFRVVKGLPYTMWGLNAGVCIARDVELWKNPSFKLISIIDKNSQNIGGFIHVFEVEINGKKILTVPGIEPSVEFLNNVGPSALYDQIEDVLKEFAKLGGYGAVYIPTSPNINSNRTDIQKAIQKKKYQVMKLSEPVNWNNVPSPYPFDEVYVIPVLK